jgi:hypothetical protein
MIKTSKFSGNKLYVPKKIKEHLGIIDGDDIIWEILLNNEVKIRKNEIKRTKFPKIQNI